MAHVNSSLESGALSPFFVHVAQIATLATESLSTMSRNSTLVKFRVENDGQCASTACFNVQNTYKIWKIAQAKPTVTALGVA